MENPSGFSGGGSSKNLEHLVGIALEWEPVLKLIFETIDKEKVLDIV